jgi:hypothetical protein
MVKDGKFEPDNTKSLRHGAFSDNALIPAALAKELDNYRTFIMSMPQISKADIIIVNQVIQQVKMTRLMELWAEENGGYFITDEIGRLFPQPAFNTLYLALHNSLARNLDRLGMTPKARQELGLTKQRRNLLHLLEEDRKASDKGKVIDHGLEANPA